jgi:hypothetical protein
MAIGCAPGREPCIAPGGCSATDECLAHRCVSLGSDPVSMDTRRFVLTPAAIGVVSAELPSHPLPSAVTFGSAAEGPSALYLKFSLAWHSFKEIDNAFLLLEPMPGTAPDIADVPVVAARVASPWKPEELGFWTQPKLAPPRARGIARSSPKTTLRVDVTEIARFLKQHRTSDHGIALKASRSATHGASYATGVSGGRAPRLELYVR